jgi:hypothetical protein
MFTKHASKITLLGIVLFTLVTLIGRAGLRAEVVMSTAIPSDWGDSPLPTLPAPPAPPPDSDLSPQAQVALQYIAECEGIPVEGLLIVNDYERTFPLLDRIFRAVLILDVRTSEGQEYHVLVDLADGRIEEDVNAIEAAEEAAYC